MTQARDEAGLRHGTGTATFANGDKYCGGQSRNGGTMRP